MHILIVIAHGSRRKQSNDEIIKLVEELTQSHSHEFDVIKYAFLEIASPNIPDALLEGINLGAEKISVLPYFLSAGRHVSEDIPIEVAKVSKDYPQINISIKPHIGSSPVLATEILRISSDD